MEESVQQSDVIESGAEVSSSDSSASSVPSTPDTQEASVDQGNSSAPFHEHPRFKELIEEKNSLKSGLEESQRIIAELQRQMSQPASPKAPSKDPYESLLDRLKGIDPEFANLQAESVQALKMLPQLQQALQEIQLRDLQTQAVSKINSLYEQHKVPQELRSFYQDRIERMAYLNPQFSIKDLDNLFKEAHEHVSKTFEVFKRKERESYVQTKKQDQVPASTTGGAPASAAGKGGKQPMSHEDAVKLLASEMRKAKQTI